MNDTGKADKHTKTQKHFYIVCLLMLNERRTGKSLP